MATAMPLAILFLFCAIVDNHYIESIAANVDSHTHKSSPTPATQRKHESFLPLVAFQCGFRNKFLNKRGEWQDDPSSTASCLHGKYNILKYCRRVYPEKDITNIVEYSHLSRIDNWCKEDGSDCHSKFTVRAYRCLIGEFVTESLQVPNKCHFSHVAGKNKCNDFKAWNTEAENQCASKMEEGTTNPMRLHSFAILEPCGIDMFRGVEYVCCPKSVEEKMEDLVELDKNTDDEDSEDDEDDYSDDEDDEDDEDDLVEQKEKTGQDSYFKDDNIANEHDRFRDAIERLERKHRKRVTKVITQWSELFERYNKMKETDQKGAEQYKREMTAKFRRTVASLEDENKEQRKQMEEVHNERVQSALNEKKRQATHDYRSALALQVGANNKDNVLRTLKAYIKAEEKDRTHMLNRYRHLLRADPDASMQFEPVLLHRLRYIDLRINGTFAMLRDFPSLEKEIRPIAEQFWKDYRQENTPEGAELGDQQASSSHYLSEDEQNELLIKFYKKTFVKDQRHVFVEPKEETLLKHGRISFPRPSSPPSTTRSTTTKKTVVVALKDDLSERDDDDSDEDQFEDEDDDKSFSATTKKTVIKANPKPATNVHVEFLKDTMEKPVVAKLQDPLKAPTPNSKKPKLEETADESSEEDSDENSDSIDSEHVYAEDNDKKADSEERELHIAVEPIILTPREDYNDEVKERAFIRKWVTQSNIMIGSMFLVMLLLWLTIRRRNRHRGFIEVEIHNPEDKRADNMQANGYENPTYKFFENKP